MNEESGRVVVRGLDTIAYQREFLERYIGSTLAQARTGVLGVLNFDRHDHLDENGEPERLGISVQTSWRIKHRGTIVYGCQDSGDPSNYAESNGIPPGVCKRVLRFLNLMFARELKVEGISIQGNGDMRIRLSKGYSIEVFISSHWGELWTLVSDSRPHVMFTPGIGLYSYDTFMITYP